jgi:phosphoserine phosphatase
MKLLVLDIEGTLFQTRVRLPGTTIDSTIWQGLALGLGQEAVDAEVATHVRWRNGQYRSYLEWVRDTIRIHQQCGLTETLFHDLIRAAEYNPGVVETLLAVNRAEFEPVLISGGFRELAARAQVDLHVRHAFAACEYFFDSRGALIGYNLLPCDFEGKIDFIRLMLAEYRLSERDWLFVGDGENDVPIARLAPVSVAYAAHPALRKVATHAIEDFRGLRRILESDTTSRADGNAASPAPSRPETP